MNRRLLGVLVLVAFTLLAAVTAGAYAGRQATTTTLTMWSYDNQDPGLEPVLKQLTKNFEKKYPNVKINLDVQGLQQPRRNGEPRARVGQRARHDRGQPGLPDRRAAR